jgi:hypothetical protein
VSSGLLTGTFVERRGAQGDPPSGTAIGSGFGLALGASAGLVAAWILSANVGYGIVVGAGTGLFVGVILGVLVPRFSAQPREALEKRVAP